MQNEKFKVQNARFEKALPVWLLGREKEMNLWISLRAVASGAKKTVLRLTGSSAYDIRVNGTFIAFGPARCAHGFYRVDEIDLTEAVSEQAVITVNVAGYNADSFYHLDQSSFICAELIEDGEITAATGADGFLCRVMTEHEQKAQRYSGQRTFTEVYRISSMISVWESAVEIEKKQFSLARLFPTEEKRFIPRGSEYNVYDKIPAQAIISRSEFLMEDYKKRVLYPAFVVPRGENTGASKKSYTVGEAETDIFLNARNIEVKCLKKTDEIPSTQSLREGEAVTYRMAYNTTGKIAFEIACAEDTEILVTFDEILGDDGLIKYRRMNTINTAMWKFKKGTYRVSTFEPYTLSVMTFHALKGKAFLSDVHMVYFGASEIGKKYCGEDENLRKIFDAAVETYRQNTFTIYMDCPSRERAGWLCDSFFTSRVEKTLTGKSEIERCFLENFFLPESFYGLPKGMFPMCYPADHYGGNFIPNWAMWLVLELEEYLERTGDRDFIDSAKERIFALLNYFKMFENKDGLLEKLEKWVFVEWSKCNELTQDINFPTNMLYAKTLRAAANLYDEPAFAQKADALKKVINEKAFTENGFYCDNAVYGEDGLAKLSGECTETCQYYAFFCDIATPEEKPELWQRMLHDFGPERIIPNQWPNFTYEAKWKNIYPSNAFIGNYLRLELLFRYGEHDKLIENIRGFFTKMADLTGTLWENDSTTASCNHGFASHVVYWMDRMGMVSE